MTPEKPDLLSVWEALGGRTRSRKDYGWTAAFCPIHNDRETSAQINEEKQVFRCHVCSVYGDVYELVMQKEGIGFRDAKRRAAELAGGVSGEVRAVPRRPGSLLPPRRGGGARAFVPPWAKR